MIRVAFLGPEGTFTEEALRASAGDALGGEPWEGVPVATVHETVMSVQEGSAERAVVPIENALEGGVAATLDALAGEAEDVRISAEAVRPVRHCLIAREDVPLDALTAVLSHPQALAQCAHFLSSRTPAAARRPATSTAEAVRAVAEGREPIAAVGPRLAAELYGCRVLADAIEDHPGNVTRFVWLARSGAAVRGEASKTSLVFWGFADESPGALVAVLREFSDRGINLTRIESRPRRVRLGHYMFFADLDGAAEAPPVSEALEALRGRVHSLRVLGSYPAARKGV